MEIEEDGGIGTYFRHLEYRRYSPQLIVSSSSNTNFLNCEFGYRGELECTSDVKKVPGRYLYPAHLNQQQNNKILCLQHNNYPSDRNFLRSFSFEFNNQSHSQKEEKDKRKERETWERKERKCMLLIPRKEQPRNPVFNSVTHSLLWAERVGPWLVIGRQQLGSGRLLGDLRWEFGCEDERNAFWGGIFRCGK